MSEQVTSAVVPGVKLNELSVDLSKLTVGFEFEFVSPISHAAFAEAMRGDDPDYKIGAVTDKYAGHKEQFKGASLYKMWHVTGDDTISKHVSGEKPNHKLYAIELISPAMPFSRAKITFSNILKLIKSVGGTTNETCGLHVTFGHPKLTTDLENFDPLKFALFLQEDKLLARFDREQNSFAQNFSARILQTMYSEMYELKSKVWNRIEPDFTEEDEGNYPEGHVMVSPSDETGPALTEANLDKLVTSLKVRQRFALYSHYMSINLIKLRKHCIEVRSPGGDYLNRDVGEMAQMVMHMARCLAVALDPELLKDKYVLAVRKMLKQYNPNRTNSDFIRTQSEKNIDDVSKSTGPTSFTGTVNIAGHTTQLTLTHGDAKNPRAEASAVWTIKVGKRLRTVLRLYVDNFGKAEAVIPTSGLEDNPDAKEVLISVCTDLLKTSDRLKPLPGLLRMSPSADAYKKLLARFPKLAALKLDTDKLRSDLEVYGILG